MAFRAYNDSDIAVICGLSDLYIAVITADSQSAYTTEAPVRLAPVAELSLAPDAEQIKTYYDNGARNILLSSNGAELTLTIAGLDPAALAAVMGWTYDATTGLLMASTTDQPGYFALGYRERALGPSNSYEYNYYWWLKGQFRPSDRSASTQGERIEPQSLELVYNAVETVHQFTYPGGSSRGGLFTMASSVDTAAAMLIATWFSAVVTPDSIAGS